MEKKEKRAVKIFYKLVIVKLNGEPIEFDGLGIDPEKTEGYVGEKAAKYLPNPSEVAAFRALFGDDASFSEYKKMGEIVSKTMVHLQRL